MGRFDTICVVATIDGDSEVFVSSLHHWVGSFIGWLKWFP